MKFWVDYTNHAGKRQWRPVMNMSEPMLELYPPIEALARHPELRDKQESAICVRVQMLDRNGAVRLLRLASIHGFREWMQPLSKVSLSLRELQDANETRQREWDPDTKLRGELGHLYRANELGGEVGEALNVIKKLVRETLDIRGSRAGIGDLGDELADVVICTALIANDWDIDLDHVTRRKFNATSEKNGLETRL